MSYTKVSPQPPLRDPNSTSISAPGLYPCEVAVQLDTGDYVAVYVERTWQENNAGLTFYTSARLTNADGSTKLCVAGKEIVIEFRHNSAQAEITAYGADALAKEHVLAILGEPLTQVPVPGGTAGETMPMIPWGPDFLANVSIRHAITATNCAGDVENLASLL